jgi:hypothetical protein
MTREEAIAEAKRHAQKALSDPASLTSSDAPPVRCCKPRTEA